MYDSTWTENALEPYKNAWHVLKETSPALFKRRAVVLSPQLRRVIEVANKRGLPFELIPLKGERAKHDYRNYKQRRIGGERLAASLVDDPMVEFVDDEEGHGYLVPLKDLKFLPRVGDTVCMPGKAEANQEVYEVTQVNHNFARDLMRRVKCGC